MDQKEGNKIIYYAIFSIIALWIIKPLLIFVYPSIFYRILGLINTIIITFLMIFILIHITKKDNKITYYIIFAITSLWTLELLLGLVYKGIFHGILGLINTITIPLLIILVLILITKKDSTNDEKEKKIQRGKTLLIILSIIILFLVVSALILWFGSLGI